MHCNRIGNGRLSHLAAALKTHTNMRVLNLNSNHISFPGACHIAEGVRESTSLQKVHLAHNKLRVDSVHRLSQVFAFTRNHQRTDAKNCNASRPPTLRWP